jgi:hypothetical protein
MAQDLPPFNFNLGYIYVAELLGLPTRVYKVGKTNQTMKDRLSAASTFAPFGIQTHRLQIFFDMECAEDRVHARLHPWHRPPEIAGQATETFSASLETIYQAIDEQVALQREWAKNCDQMFDELRSNGFLAETPDAMLEELLQAPVAPKLTLKGAIIRCLNSTSFEKKLCLRLMEHGIDINRKTRIAKVECTRRLARLCPGAARKKHLAAALSTLTHFNSLGTPVFA